MPTSLVHRIGELFGVFSFSTIRGKTHLLEGLVVDETCCIFRNLKLAFLNLLTKLPK